MASRLRPLRHEDVSAGFRDAQSFGNFSRRIHNLAAGVVSALKIVTQVLILAGPCKGGDRRLSAQRNREHILLDLEQ